MEEALRPRLEERALPARARRSDSSRGRRAEEEGSPSSPPREAGKGGRGARAGLRLRSHPRGRNGRFWEASSRVRRSTRRLGNSSRREGEGPVTSGARQSPSCQNSISSARRENWSRDRKIPDGRIPYPYAIKWVVAPQRFRRVRDLELRFRPPFGGGTLAPFFLASLKPMAIACFRLLTFCPEPLSSVPLLRL